MQFTKAVKTRSKLRMAIAGPSGAGKTYTALTIGCALADLNGTRAALIDTERGSASKYSDQFDFDVLELESFSPTTYVEAIGAAQQAGYGVLIVDSLSHAWAGKGGALEMVDNAARRSQSSNSFAAWREVTPLHNQLVDSMLSSNLHLIVTLRSKQDYVQERDDKGRTQIRKVGLAPVQRDGLEYEFDVFADMDIDNTLMVGKTRCPALSGLVVNKPGADLAARVNQWLSSGEAPVEAAPHQIDPSTMVNLGDRAMKKWEELAMEAKRLNLEVKSFTPPISLSQLTDLATELKNRIAEAKSQQPQAK